MTERPSDQELLQRLPGIGGVKSERLVEEFGDNPRGAIGAITTSSTGRFDEIEGFTLESGKKLQEDMRAFDIDQGIYDEDPRDRQSETFGEFSESVKESFPGASQDPSETSGLTAVSESDFSRTEKKRAKKFHEARSERAQAVDEALAAPVADSLDDWLDDKAGLDIPGVDR